MVNASPVEQIPFPPQLKHLGLINAAPTYTLTLLPDPGPGVWS